METQEDPINIVMKVEVEENPLKLPEDIEQESITEAKKIEDSVNKLKEYLKAKDEEYDKKVEDTRVKLNIAQNVLQACKLNEPLNVSPIEKLHKYTKLPISELVGMINEDVPKMSLKKAIEDTEKIPPFATTIYNDIREVFIECYVKMRQMPSVTVLLKSLSAIRDKVLYKNLSITKLVTNKLVKYHYFPNLNSYILTENPEFSYRRHLYLKQISQYRQQNASIVYVVVMNIMLTDRRVHYLLLAASTQGLITRFSYTQNVNVLSMENQVKVWIRNELIPKISTSSIVVLMQSKKPDPTPTINSSREKMTRWLVDHSVPHDNASHRSDLYNLIKLSKKKFKASGDEEVLASAGFKVLVCPAEYPNLDFFNTIQIHANNNKTVKLDMMVKMISQSEWRQMEKPLIELEKQMLREDAEMDKIIENLFQMVKSGELKEEDFPANCRASKADNFAVHIGDIIID